jgi:FkbM family methyltransferase
VDNYWLTERRFILNNFDHFRRAAGRLADAASVATLAALVRYRFTGALSAAPVARPDEQYTPEGLLRFSKPITFVDGGAYNGDTRRHLASRGIDVAHWLAFEPNPDDFRGLAAFAGGLDGQSTLFPCGLSDKFMLLPFAASDGMSSHLGHAEGGHVMTVPCVALDEVMHGPKPDYIKLDIEGTESQALRGMAKTIAVAQPYLAVSAYHRPEDLWALIDQLTEQAPYAALFLRQHGLNAFDSVLYAIPRH